MKDEMLEKTEELRRRAAIVGVYDGYHVTEEDIDISLDELVSLADTAGADVLVRVTQARVSPDKRTYIGSGKVTELAEICKNEELDLVVFDDELSPSQIRNIEDELGDDVTVIDRSMLILDIFARHAVTGEGKLQVELAQLKYSAPRLTGHGTEMSRQGAVGGNPIGTRGPGETKLEIDRRRMKTRIAALESEIRELERTRSTMRAARDRSGLLRVSIVGYTNAGKSTLLNRLTDAGILAEDKLFATLDPTTRKFRLPSGVEILLTDTVGFIRKLPHHLIKAFRSTLDEAVYADIILIVVDASDPEYEAHIAVTEELLTSLGAENKPTIYVFNKCDKTASSVPRVSAGKKSVYISASTGKGVETMLNELESVIRSFKRVSVFSFPSQASGLVAKLYRSGEVKETDYLPDGTVRVTAIIDEAVIGQLKDYLVE